MTIASLPFNNDGLVQQLINYQTKEHLTCAEVMRQLRACNYKFTNHKLKAFYNLFRGKYDKLTKTQKYALGFDPIESINAYDITLTGVYIHIQIAVNYEYIIFNEFKDKRFKKYISGNDFIEIKMPIPLNDQLYNVKRIVNYNRQVLIDKIRSYFLESRTLQRLCYSKINVMGDLSPKVLVLIKKYELTENRLFKATPMKTTALYE